MAARRDIDARGISTAPAFVRRIADPRRGPNSMLKATGIDPASYKLSLFYDSRATGRLVVEALELQLEKVLGVQVEAVEPGGRRISRSTS